MANEQPKKGIFETIADKNARITAEAILETNKLLERLVEIEQRRDMDYGIWEISVTGKPGFTFRCGKGNSEAVPDWIARQKDILEQMEVLRKPRIPLKEELENAERPSLNFDKGGLYRKRQYAKKHGYSDADIEKVLRGD